MKPHARLLLLMAFLASLFTPLSAAPTINTPAGIDPKPWDALLKKHVNDEGLVAYEKWKSDAADMKALDAFLEGYSPEPKQPAKGAEEIAALINAYNAFTIRWILQNYPTESIRALDDSFGGARWKISGRTVSLDEIEHKNLRPLIGWKVHATIVCAARSCPPLQREAFIAEKLDAQINAAYRAWLGREDLNRFDPAANRVVVSPIFKWFKDDFTGDGELPKMLARHAPERNRAFLEKGEFKIEYLDYNWGLNDQSGRGSKFRAGLLDRLFGNAK
ncbi:MAG: DUF547 domain-containing protein [Opitutaceae bacterium]